MEVIRQRHLGEGREPALSAANSGAVLQVAALRDAPIRIRIINQPLITFPGVPFQTIQTCHRIHNSMTSLLHPYQLIQYPNPILLHHNQRVVVCVGIVKLDGESFDQAGQGSNYLRYLVNIHRIDGDMPENPWVAALLDICDQTLIHTLTTQMVMAWPVCRQY